MPAVCSNDWFVIMAPFATLPSWQDKHRAIPVIWRVGEFSVSWTSPVGKFKVAL